MSSAAGLTPNGGAVHLATLFLLDFCSLASFAELGFVCGKYRKPALRDPFPTSWRKAEGFRSPRSKVGSPAQLRRRTCVQSAVDVAARGDVLEPRWWCSLFVLARHGESPRRNFRAFPTPRAGYLSQGSRLAPLPWRHARLPNGP